MWHVIHSPVKSFCLQMLISWSCNASRNLPQEFACLCCLPWSSQSVFLSADSWKCLRTKKLKWTHYCLYTSDTRASLSAVFVSHTPWRLMQSFSTHKHLGLPPHVNSTYYISLVTLFIKVLGYPWDSSWDVPMTMWHHCQASWTRGWEMIIYHTCQEQLYCQEQPWMF